jgi:hypothetical protein
MQPQSSPAQFAIDIGKTAPERMLATAALIDQALACFRSHPQEAELLLTSALRILGVQKRTASAPDAEGLAFTEWSDRDEEPDQGPPADIWREPPD